MALTKNINDITIVNLIRKGDNSAYTLFYDNYAPLLYGIIYRIVNDQLAAEKLLEKTIMKIWKEHTSYDPGKLSFSTWIMNIARNMSKDEAAHQQEICGQPGSQSLLDLVLIYGMDMTRVAECMNISVSEAIMKFRQELKKSISLKP